MFQLPGRSPVSGASTSLTRWMLLLLPPVDRSQLRSLLPPAVLLMSRKVFDPDSFDPLSAFAWGSMWMEQGGSLMRLARKSF